MKNLKKNEKSSVTSFVQSYTELAVMLETTRQTVSRWRKMKGAPRPASDGRHNVKLWREFVASNDLGNKAAGETDEIKELRVRELLAKCEEREFKNAVKRGEYCLVEEVRTTWTSCITAALQLLDKSFLDELPPILAGKTPIEIRGELEKTILEFRRLVHTGEESLTP